MREIKFRGIRKNSGEFVYGFYVQNQFDGTSMVIEHGICRKGRYPVEIILETLGQYTGLKGSNGVEIYEGDILDGFENEIRMKCEFSIDDCAFIFNWSTCAALINQDYTANFIVIGNVHQHSELLGGDV